MIMEKINIGSLVQYFAALNNEKRLQIIALCAGEGKTIRELAHLVKLSYHATSRYIVTLSHVGAVHRLRQPDGRVIIKSTIRIHADGTITRIVKTLSTGEVTI